MCSLIITTEIIIALMACPRKAHLLLENSAPKSKPELVSVLEQRRLDNCKREGIEKSPKLSIIDSNSIANTPQNKVTGVVIRAANLEASSDALILEYAENDLAFYKPIHVTALQKIKQEDCLNLAFAGYVLGLIQNHVPNTGIIIDSSGKHHSIRLDKYYTEIKQLIDTINKWHATPSREVAQVALNTHCPSCCYESFCVPIAESKNDITLLDRITPRIAKQYNKKGIFTVEQLSFLFRPRRKRKTTVKKHQVYKPELQALAIRNNKTYVHVIPNITRSETELFLDLEGIPDNDTYYLIGLLVSTGTTREYWSFWADAPEDEERGWNELIKKLMLFPDVPIYHYGSFESRYFDKMEKRHPMETQSVKERLKNLNEHIHGKVYFPTRSNRLKDIMAFLGFKGNTPILSGLESILWRLKWEKSGEEVYKAQLRAYNSEDCYAVYLLLEELTRIANLAEKASDIDFADKPKQQATETGAELHSAFDRIIRSAHAEYEQAKIKLFDENGERKKRKQGGQPGHPGKTRKVSRPNKTIHVVSRKECPKCLGSQLRETKALINQNIVDLELKRQGWKKVITRYSSYYAYCPKCTRQYGPPELSTVGRPEKFGSGLRAWIIYHRVVLRLSFPSIIQALNDQYKISIGGGSVPRIIHLAAVFYEGAKKRILSNLLSSPFVHADETKISIRGETQYVWVFTNGTDVLLELTETREADIVHKYFGGYSGILVSDFYGGYDSVDCIQQKCLVHLIRDINEELWKSPFDQEFESFIFAFKNMIIPILRTVDEARSKKVILQPFLETVDQFYEKTVSKKYTSEAVRKFQKRFVRYRSSLFTFLKHDNIPWNNNMAERAIRHLAVQRKISGSFSEKGAGDYIALLSLAQTCKFQNKSFLDFLLSQKEHPDDYNVKGKIKR